MRLNRELKLLSSMGEHELIHGFADGIRACLAAGGAGSLTALTVTLKLWLVHSGNPALMTAPLVAMDFVASFVLMQWLGFRLATKLAPLLGAALGAEIGPWRDRLTALVRTQAVSAAGNLAFVLPASLAVWALLGGSVHVISDPAVARASLRALDCSDPRVPAYAAMTGGLLWLCAYAGGRIGSRLRFPKRVASLVFNCLLGVLLALIPLVGQALDLPLDVRHFTLSAGTWAMALATLGWNEALRSGLAQAAAGVILIGGLNFGVSFCLGCIFTRLNRGDRGLASAAFTDETLLAAGLPLGLATRQPDGLATPSPRPLRTN